MFDNSQASNPCNPKCINQNTSFQYSSYFETQPASLFQDLKSLITDLVL